MNHYDLIVILGSKQGEDMRFPSHVHAALDRAVELYDQGIAPAIALSGKWALEFDHQGIVPPAVESALMADYLEKHGISKAVILQEDKSKDTVANLYYLKQTVFEPHQAKRLLFVLADFRIERVRFLAHKILGSAYTVDFMTISSPAAERYPDEAQTLERTKYYLKDMTPGDDDFVKDMFYDHPFYTAPWPVALSAKL